METLPFLDLYEITKVGKPNKHGTGIKSENGLEQRERERERGGEEIDIPRVNCFAAKVTGAFIGEWNVSSLNGAGKTGYSCRRLKQDPLKEKALARDQLLD